jgi:hypothetical protein
METKELKIQAPKGYEIDKENSTFECVRFKPIHNPTYKDISNMLFNSDITDYYRINNMGKINKYISHVTTFNGDIDFYFRKNVATNEKQLERLLALNQLLNIAEYYNRLHTKIDKCYNILYDMRFKGYRVNTASAWYRNSLTGIEALFNRAEDAQAVIDNPNFQEILDTIYKN